MPLITEPEEIMTGLHPDLLPWYEEEGPLGAPAIRHPLVYSVFHHESFNDQINKSYLAKKKAVAEARRRRQWSSYIFLHERPYRIAAFESLVAWSRVGDQAYWRLLGEIWTDSENIWQNQELWQDCLTAERPYRSHLMNAEERKALRCDIDKTGGRIYRGYSSNGNPAGLSWTTNSIVAKYFARRLTEPGETLYLATGVVDRKDVIAFFDGRSESEIVVLPENVREIEITEIEKERA